MAEPHHERYEKRQDLQGLRGVSVLLVVLFHSGLGPPGGFLGVDVFMVLSGFVITAMLLRELEGTGVISLREFYARRVRRLLPPLSLLLIVVVSINLMALSPFGQQQFSIKTGAASTVLVANIFLYRNTGYFGPEAEFNSFLHLWSLSVEEHVYLVLPVLLFAAAGVRIRRRAEQQGTSRTSMAWVIAAASVLSFVLAVGLNHGWFDLGLEAPGRFAFYSMPTRLWEFGAGILLAISWDRVSRISRRMAEVIGMCGVVGIAFAAWATDPGAAHPDVAAIIPVVAATALIAAGVHSTLVTRLLALRPLAWIGDQSYAWYLWHWPAIVLSKALWPGVPASVPLAAAASLLPAMFSTRFVELPLRRNESIRGWKAVRLGALCTLLPLAVLGGALHLANGGLGLREPSGWYDTPEGGRAGCNYYNRDGRAVWPGERCTTSVSDSLGTVLIVGDEHADSVSPGVIAAAEEVHLDTALWSRSGCPMVAATPVHSPGCDQFKADVLELVDVLQPDIVVIANQSADYTTDASSELALAGASGGHPGNRAELLALWSEGLDATIKEFGRRRIPVILVAGIPTFGEAFPRDHVSLLNPEPPIPTVSRVEVEASRSDVLTIERAAAATTDGLRLVDTVPLLCGATCSPVRGEEWLYYDRTHLTIRGSELLADDLRNALVAEIADA